MLLGTVLLMLFLNCVNTAPEPRQTKVTLIRDSLLGYNFDAGDKKASGTLDGTRTIDIELPDAAADKAPEITLLENVNSGAGLALGDSVDIDAIIKAKDKVIEYKDKLFSGKLRFWRKK